MRRAKARLPSSRWGCDRRVAQRHTLCVIASGRVRGFVTKIVRLICTTTGLFLASAVPVYAQTGATDTTLNSAETVEFAANSLEYQNDLDIVTAIGDVRGAGLERALRRDEVVKKDHSVLVVEIQAHVCFCRIGQD